MENFSAQSDLYFFALMAFFAINLLLVVALIKNFRNLKRTQEALSQNKTKVINEAQNRANSIIDQALKKAEEEISTSDEVKLQKFKEFSENIKQVAKSESDQLKTDLETFRKSLTKEAINTQENIESEVKTSLSQAEEEIKAYKEKRFKEIETEINTTLKNVLEKVLGKVIPVEEHERYVLEQLEKVKKEGVFKDV